MVTRRRLLTAAGAVGAAAALPAALPSGLLLPSAAARIRREEVLLTATVQPTQSLDDYVYVPFEMPAGVNRLDARIDKKGQTLGIGLFDHRGPQNQSPGFRGVYSIEGDPGGEEGQSGTGFDNPRTFFLTETDASVSMIPGRFTPGTWTFIVPVFFASRPTTIEILVTLTYGPSSERVFAFGPDQGTVREGPEWYRGDLHCHTPESSDAGASGTALTPRAWADTCRSLGLDFVAMTDHNVVSQNFTLAADAGADVLLMPGEEMTSYFGHATVSGIEPGDWLDFRQRPQGRPLRPNESRITEFLEVARGMGAFVSAAHPVEPGPTLPWQFFQDSEVDVAALPDGLEVWNGTFRSEDEAAVLKWDQELQRGRRLVANGGSDLHGTVNETGLMAGTPTTVVFAERLEKQAIVAALKQGRCFMTRAPNGGELYLTAEGPGDAATFTGGTIYGSPGDTVAVRLLVVAGPLVRRFVGSSLRAILYLNGEAIATTLITQTRQTVEAVLPVGSGGHVRAELRSQQEQADETQGERADMEALTNAIFLVAGERPGDAPLQETAPPPRRAPARARQHDRRTQAASGTGLAATGAALAARSPAARAADGAEVMSIGEFRSLAAVDGPLAGRLLRLEGTVADPAVEDAVRLREFATDCCGTGRVAMDVLLGLPAGAVPELGTRVTATGRWRAGSGAFGASIPCLDCDSVSILEPL